MIDQIISHCKHFRNRVFETFTYRADTTMNLIDAAASSHDKQSIVQLSLSPLFERTYSSITDSLENLFVTTSDSVQTEEERYKEQHLFLPIFFQ